MAVVEDFHRDFLPRFIDAQHAFHDGDPAPNNALWTDSDPVTLFARVVGPFVRCCGWGAGGQEAAMGALCGARFSWAPKYARLASSRGRSMPRRLRLVGVVAVVAAALTGCTGEPQPAGPGTQSAAGKPLVAQFVDDAEAIEPVFALEGDEVPVSVAGRRFQTRCVGTGDPAVILVSGASTPQTTWHEVHAKVGAKTRVCSYDRLGVGDSGPPAPVQTLEQLAADLDGVIDALALPRPLVVAGHSLGGPIAMAWATKRPADTVGVVLIDASSAAFQREDIKQVREHYPGDVALNADPEHLDLAAVPAQLDALPRLGAVPLVVLTRTLYQPDPTYPKIDWDAYERAWVEGQRHWATYSDVSEMVSVPNAGHFIHLNQLNVVIAAVLRIL